MEVAPEFTKLFANAVSLYPNPGIHEGSLSAYWRHLQAFDLPVLREGFRRAVTASKEFFPSAETVRACAEAAAKTAALPKPDYTRPALTDGRQERQFVPAIGAGHEQWLDEAKTPFERLERMWLLESKHMGWDRGKPMPEEDGARRWTEFWATWAKTEKEADARRRDSKTADTSGWPEMASASPSTVDGSSELPPWDESSADEQSHGDGCTCADCMPAITRLAEELGLLR